MVKPVENIGKPSKNVRKPLKKVEYHKLNKKQIMVCKDCIAMNGHKIVKGAESLCTN